MDRKHQKILDLLENLNDPIPSIKRYKQSIKDLVIGSFIKLKGELFYVEEVSSYKEVKWNFKKRNSDYYVYELKLFSMKNGEYTYLEFEEDDEITYTLTDKVLSFNSLTFQGSTLKSDHLDYIADEEEGSLIYNGKKYYYSDEESWAALYNSIRNVDVKVRFYEFESNDDEYLTIEMWHDESSKPEKEAFLSSNLNENDIEIIQL